MRRAGEYFGALAAVVLWMTLSTAAAADDADGGGDAGGEANQTYTALIPCRGPEADDAEEDVPPPLEFHGPIALVNQQPPNPIILSPVPEQATVLAEGDSFFRFKLDLTNHLIREIEDGVVTDFDFESMRFEAAYHRGMWGGEGSVRYPMGYLGSGFLDGFIRGFHQLIQQRSDIRMAGDPYQFRFVIITRDGLVANAQSDSWHFGNLVLGYKYPLWNKRDGRDALAVRAAVKVPSRDAGNLLGIGGWDYQVGVLYQKQLARRLRGYINLDYVLVSEGDWDNVGYQDTPVALYALEYAVDRKNTVVLQWRSHRNPIQMGSEQADKDSQELSYGFHHRTSNKCVWTFGMSEDARGMTAPDVIFMTYLKWEL